VSRDAWNRLAASLPDAQRRMERRVLETLRLDYLDWHTTRTRAGSLPPSLDEGLPLADFLTEAVTAAKTDIDDLRVRHARFLREFALASTEDERRRRLLDHARALGADRRQLAGDEAALARWFGADALGDRVTTRIARLERRITVALALLGLHARALLAADGGARRWERLAVEDTARALFTFDGHPRVRLAAFLCLANALRGLPAAAREGAVQPGSVQFIYRCALDARQYVWLQAEAIDLLREIAPAFFIEVVELRLTRPHGGDDLFVRRRALQLAANSISALPRAAALLPLGLEDGSAYVRQGLAEVLPHTSQRTIEACLPALLADAVPQVRAQALLALADIGDDSPLPTQVWLLDRIESEDDSFVLRTALHVVERLAGAAADACPRGARFDNTEGRAAELARIADAVSRLHQRAADLRVRRWAANALQCYALSRNPDLRTLVERLTAQASACPPGCSRRLPADFDALPGEHLARAALMLARTDHALGFERRFGHWRLHRGDRFGFRLWRWLHEFRHPSPDKRQAFRHTIGRIFASEVHVPSQILAELAQTKVPGEPLHMASEAGWRPWLPLPDQLLSCLDLPARKLPLRIHTAEGVTEVAPPRALLARLRIRLRLVRDFVAIARARNWQEHSQQSADHYAALLRDYGFELRFRPYPDIAPDPAVTRFFPAGFALGVGGEDLWERFEAYFFSVYGNSLFELTLFLSAALAAFTARHLLANRSLRRARAQLPLVVGGWGTRGKSGTERIKAALFNSLGYGVVSKTTGCEAMFLHGHPHQPLREMFLFRPYDKATIWEQHDVTRIAAELEADVFLWECMALTPAFVQLLQRHWMRDDLSTITNTFPDHEDLQGPAGINIPQVMTNFIRERGTLITSEEQMRPILADAAGELGTRLEGVGWLESGLLAPDVLDRFPYQEHPDNIALVVRMAAELGIDADYALKEMADNVVPDLGVLKVYPQAEVDGRRLSFANGMSANERFGCLNNWIRLGFDRIDCDAEPDVMITAVVNNRADRIARSRVFAGVVVKDISADLYVLIGSNLEGLNGYIREAWDEHAADLSLWPESGEAPLAVLESQARRLRIPYSPARVQARLAAMLSPLPEAERTALLALCQQPEALAAALTERGLAHAAEIAAFTARAAESQAEYTAFAARLATAPSQADAALDADFRTLLWRWFERKLYTVTDYYASGNRIVQIIAQHTPPAFHNRVMGIQNIKGTGLDFVYRWQAWAQCHAACADLRAANAPRFRRGLAALAAFQEYGLLTEAHVRDTLALARQAPHAQLAIAQAQLAQIESDLQRAMRHVHEQLSATREQGHLERLVLMVEGFVDAGDAVRRRRTANRIYRDLVAQRISHSRAAIELLRLTQQQKGGWLYARIEARAKVLQVLAEQAGALLRRLRRRPF
jgi:poly-gamma-glutamate synthase PgsB/CapB